MDDIAKRLEALTSEQRELLELRLRKKGLQSPLARDDAAHTIETAAPESHTPDDREDPLAWKTRRVERSVRFSIYFFSDDGSKNSDDKYRLLMESAKFADRHGFDAVWTPERHFQAFGGLYPNPSVLSAALAMITERTQIRAGSVALPLHHPVRVAEEWSVVDNLSRGRVGVSFASGWHPNDFLFAPAAYDERKEVMFRHIETIRKLWAGESVTFESANGSEVEVSILPKPIQPQLPIWITTAGNPETWSRAGAIGANVLAALPGYAPSDLAGFVRNYRAERARHGHDPDAGIVSLMAHTFIGEANAAVKEKVRQPFSNYLRNYFKQFENVQADPSSLSEADKDALMAAAFETYFQDRTLMGTPAKCARLIETLSAAGVDELACLIDFGVDTDSVLESLNYLNELREHFAQAASAVSADSTK
ncbi:MAG TPA: LLM class flavin-dependent oxidoreductase [Pyrinomonadaceae bacterium]|nr:LLM class flavin-dependent oxidoreductase [Pyrinomonadaceae bacterium]